MNRGLTLKMGISGVISLLIMAASCFAERSVFWGDLEPGQYGVGYRTIERYDSSRVFGNKTDYFGQVIPGERLRPMQICLWYPAETSDSDIKVVLGEYSFTYPNNDEFMRHLSMIQNRDIGYWMQNLGIGSGVMLNLLSVNMEAVKDAPIADGSFPLLIYFTSLQGDIEENATLCEYLASHGFIVAATHPIGQNSVLPGLSQADLETAIRDRELVWATARTLPGVNPDKLGVFGLSSGGAAALLMQMRNGDVDAVAGMEDSFTFPPIIELIKENPFYDANKAVVPIMQFYSGSGEKAEYGLIQDIRFAPIYSYDAGDFSRDDFSIFGTVKALIPDSTGKTGTVDSHKYDAVCRMVLNYFRAVLNDDDKSLQYTLNTPETNGYPADLYKVKFTQAKEIPPTEQQFASIIQTHGAETACDLYYKFHPEFPDWRFFDEATINAYGYRMLQMGQVDQANKLFKLNADANPKSANCWDSYADGLLAAGDSTNAAGCYRKVLQILDEDSQSNMLYRDIIKANAEAFLGQTGQ